jgi:hypothetical protein
MKESGCKGYKSVDLFQKMGNSYYSNSRLDKAAKWYGELFAITADLDQNIIPLI